MVISIRKSKAMHVHRIRRVDAITEEDVAALTLTHKCESCGREFTKQHGLKIHMARWRPYSAIPSRFSNRYSSQDSQSAGATLDKVSIGDYVLKNVLNFQVSRQQTAM